jgi:hypothetical protein
LENAAPEQTTKLTRWEWIQYPRQTWEKRIVYKQRDKFNKLEQEIADNVKHSGFNSLDISQQHGVMKKAASLINEFKTSSQGALDPHAGANRNAYRKSLKKINEELGRVSDLLDKLAVVNDTNRFRALWNGIRPEDQKSKFKGDPKRLRTKLQNRVNDAIPAYIEKHDGSFLAGRDKLANRKALRNFEKYSKWLANLTRPVDEYVNPSRL